MKVVAIVDTDHNLHIYPNTPETIEKTRSNLDKIYVYLVNKDTNVFAGFKVKYANKKFSLFRVWKVNVPADQTIKSITQKRNDEVVNSVGRVLGDHTVLYKYLNPNLVGFVAVSGSGLKGSVFVYIVDAVTGELLILPLYLSILLSPHIYQSPYHPTKNILA